MKGDLIRVLTTPAVALVFAVTGAFGQDAAVRSAQSPVEMASTIKDLTSQEQAWAQSCRRIAAIYRGMAVPSESDPAQVREMKRQYTLLADSQESAAVAAEKMAADHARLLAIQAPDTETSNTSTVPRNLNTGLFTR
jgi:prephenate dehydratase